MMKLQAALDFFRLEDAVKLMEKIHPYVDIAEIGTPLMLSEGVCAVTRIKALYPHIEVLADMKIMDGGDPIASCAFEAGADIVTILGLTNDSTAAGAVAAARRYGKRVCADTIGVSDLVRRTEALDALGVDFIAVHTAHDMLSCVSAPIEALKVIKASVRRAQTVISGGITVAQIPEIAAVGPDVVIVGSALTTAKDPAAVASALADAMKSFA